MLPILIFLVSLSCALFAVFPSVSAHGYVNEVTLGSTKYTGYLPYADPYMVPTPQRIIRRVPWNGPVQNVSLIDIQCNGYTAGGVPPAPAPLVGTIAAGDPIKLAWTSWPDNHRGPVLTYMARVPDTEDITKWSPAANEAVWFKIHHDGQHADGTWGSDTFTPSGSKTASYIVRVPRNLRPGKYIIRHEIMALHFAFEYPGIQIYPSCIQVEVTGTGDAFPTEFVGFPGEYKHNTPGIIWDLYGEDDSATSYPIPGPDVWTGGDA